MSLFASGSCRSYHRIQPLPMLTLRGISPPEQDCYKGVTHSLCWEEVSPSLRAISVFARTLLSPFHSRISFHIYGGYSVSLLTRCTCGVYGDGCPEPRRSRLYYIFHRGVHSVELLSYQYEFKLFLFAISKS